MIKFKTLLQENNFDAGVISTNEYKLTAKV